MYVHYIIFHPFLQEKCFTNVKIKGMLYLIIFNQEEKNMKKILAVILSLIVIFSATAMVGYAADNDTVDYFAVSSVAKEDKTPTVEWFKGTD